MKKEVSNLTIGELADYERAMKPLILKYENSVKNYDGSVKTDSTYYRKYEVLNKIYLKILDEIEKRVLELWEN